MAEKPLKVAMLSVHTCPLATLGGKKTGGMNVYVRELSRELGHRGTQVDIFTRLQESCTQHITDSSLVEGVRVIHIPAGPLDLTSPIAMFDYLTDFVAGVRIFAEQEQVSYDLIHSHYWLSGQVARDLKRDWQIPIIQMFHTLGHMKNRIALSPEDREPELRLRVEKEAMTAADTLIAATPAEKIQLMWLYGADMHKIRVIPPGVDVQTFHPIDKSAARRIIDVPEHNKMLLFVGRMERLKGLDTLMRAMEILKRDSPRDLEHLCLSVIGGVQGFEAEDDAEFRRLKALRKELGLEDLVTFLGARGQETLQYYYAAAEAVIMPSHYESFGLVALEAMACGTPVIASEVGGLAYLIQDGITGFHVPDQDPLELAGRIRLLLENDELRQEMSAAAVRSAQAYQWPRIAGQIIEVYQELASKKRALT